MESKRQESVEPIIPNIYKSSKIAATINLALAIYFFVYSNLIPKENWFNYLASYILFGGGVLLLMISCNEFRISAALDRSIKMVKK